MKIEELIALLSLERLEANLFRGQNQDIGSPSIFGGQVLAQAMAAASATVDGRSVHSLHSYFLRAGDKAKPVVYEVDRIRDGGTFATRRVVAIQNGKAIFTAAISYQLAEQGFNHQCDAPAAPPPETLESDQGYRVSLAHLLPEDQREFFARERPVELRPVAPEAFYSDKSGPPEQMLWMRAVGKMPDDPDLHQAVLAYASDFYLIGTSLKPHGVKFFTGEVRSASLDHAMWFHRPFRVDDWLLYVMDSPSASQARGLNSGKIFSRDGALVASCMQEGLIRSVTDKPA
ncbi:MAG TPA: acyl-CoA thioesterase II [Porticoccaceae bacterium]|nr:acyl-CoA thioesterase II [Porticoccaceae bacterium]HCO60389.1 acyl-CoA thioesterase II [Porticoccaceae bacterium]